MTTTAFGNRFWCLGLAALSVAVGAATPALADQVFGSATIFGGDNQSRIVCSLSNLGSSSITLANPTIFDAAGFARPLAQNSCGATLATKQSCTLAANTASQAIYGCKVRVNSLKSMRGTIQVFDSTGGLLQTQSLR